MRMGHAQPWALSSRISPQVPTALEWTKVGRHCTCFKQICLKRVFLEKNLFFCQKNVFWSFQVFLHSKIFACVSPLDLFAVMRPEDDVWRCFGDKVKDGAKKCSKRKCKGCQTIVADNATRARAHADQCEELRKPRLHERQGQR